MTHTHRSPIEGEIRPLLRSERLAANNWRRTLRLWAHAGLGQLFGRPETVGRMLDRALARRGGPGMSPFAVPLPFALAGFGDRLRVELPTAVLRHRLVDWVGDARRSYHLSDYFLGFGDWDSLAFPFAQTGVMREAVELVQADLDFRRTRCFRIYRERMEAGNPVRRNKVELSSDALLESYFQRYVSLFRSIREHGVVSLRGRGHAFGLSGVTDVRPVRAAYGERDIGVAIGPGGALYALPGGKHRAAIATVLGVATVPAEVRLIHAEWLSRVATGEERSIADAVTSGIASIGHGVDTDGLRT